MNDLPVDLLAALRDARVYPHPAGPIEHYETHISHVFLAGDYAYKLKKPVDFGFLDFTTLAKRRHACAEEVRLNARLAPDYYLGVASICDGERGLAVHPDGCSAGETEIEVAVRMRRLPQDGMLDRLAQSGRLEAGDIADMAMQLARFHAHAARGPDVDRYGHVESVRTPVLQNFEQTRPYIGAVVGAAAHAHLRAAAERFLATRAALFEQRVAGGRIVDGHGDLHLRNMCRAGGRVVIFDCIEFNPALRAGDVIGDIAFLTMDLDHRGLAALSNRFLNEYLEQTRDYAGLRLLDFYQAYRACVRAKVLAFESEREPAAAREAAAYFALAETYAAPRRAGLLITCGVSGSGKTTLARAAAGELGAVMVRSDAVRKHLAGIELSQRGDATLYSREMTTRTYAALLEHAREIVASGRWAILDAVFARRAERAAVVRLARELGVPSGILYCEAPRAELARRLDRRAAEGRDVSDATSALLPSQMEHFEPLLDDERPRFADVASHAGLGAWLAALRART